MDRTSAVQQHAIAAEKASNMTRNQSKITKFPKSPIKETSNETELEAVQVAIGALVRHRSVRGSFHAGPCGGSLRAVDSFTQTRCRRVSRYPGRPRRSQAGR